MKNTKSNFYWSRGRYLKIKFVNFVFGVPRKVHSDQDRNFASELFQNLCRRMDIRKTRTTALHPHFDGMVEKMNRTMGKYLPKMISGHQRNCDRHLPLFLMAYHSAVHETTGHTHSMVLFGRKVKLSCDLASGRKPDEKVVGKVCISNLQQRMCDIHEEVWSHNQATG